jgi:hypothetical protein
LAEIGRPAGDDELILALLPRFAGNPGSDVALFDPIRLVRMVNEMAS